MHPRVLSILCSLLLAVAGSTAAPAIAQDQPAASDDPSGISLASIPRGERQAMDRLLESRSWPKRALAIMRLERFDCTESRLTLEELATDQSWQVRAFALRSLSRRRIPQGDWLDNEADPRVIRSALRHRYHFDEEKLARGARTLLRSNNLEDKMLGIELAMPSSDDELHELANEAGRRIVLRMTKKDVGSLSPRLAVMTGQPDMKKPYLWQRWLPGRLKGMGMHPAYAVPEPGQPIEPSLFANLSSDQFIKLEGYITTLEDRHVDLAICLDCTASMWNELADTQGGLDDLMLFVGDMVASLRVAIIAYRDRRERFETRAWPFTFDIAEARRHLWSLTADGGGDKPEAVHPALTIAYTQLDWNMNSERIVVLVGDAPPHVGLGGLSINLAKRGRRGGWTTHVIQAAGKDVKHFPEIAKAGGGQCVTLEKGRSVIAEITGLTIGDQFAEEMNEYFETYLLLCR